MAVAVSAEQQADTFVRCAHKLLIDCEWVEAASGQTFATLNPATEETLAEVAHGRAARCSECTAGEPTVARAWSREDVGSAIRDWQAVYGPPPTYRDWTPSRSSPGV